MTGARFGRGIDTIGTAPRPSARGSGRLPRPGVRTTAAAAFGVLAMFLAARPASAQGCILIRQNAPVFGAEDQIVFTPGEWVLSFNYRFEYH